MSGLGKIAHYSRAFPLDVPCGYPTIGPTCYKNLLTTSGTRRWSYVAPTIRHDQTTVRSYGCLDFRSGHVWGLCCSSPGTATQTRLLGLSVSALERRGAGEFCPGVGGKEQGRDAGHPGALERIHDQDLGSHPGPGHP